MPLNAKRFLTIELQKLPVGGKTAPAFWTFWKKCRFRHSETTDSFPKIGLNFPGNLWSAFDDVLWCPAKKGNLFLKRCAMFFPLTSPCASSRSDQWPPKGFWFWSSSNAIATPWCFASILGSHGGWFWSRDYMVWPTLTVATSHRPHLCESEHVFF